MRKSSSGVSSRLKQSFANTSVSSTDSASSSASAASAAARLTTTRPAAAASTPATDHGTVKLARVKSLNLNPVAKPAPVPRRSRPSLGVAQPLDTTSEVKQTGKPLVHMPMKRRPSVGESAKSAPSEKVPMSSAAAARKPLPGHSSLAAAASKPPAGQSSSSASVAKKPLPGRPSSAAAASKPPAGKPRLVVKGATAASSKFSEKK